MSIDPRDSDLWSSTSRDSGEMRISRVVPIEGSTGSVSDEAGEASGNAAQPDGRHITLRFPMEAPTSDEAGEASGNAAQSDGRHITLRFPPPMVYRSVSRVEFPQETLSFDLEDAPFEDQSATGGPSDRGSPVEERFFANDFRDGPESSRDDEVVRPRRGSRWVWVAVTCAALILIAGAVLKNRQQLGAGEPMRSQSRSTSHAVAAQSAVPSTARSLERPEIATPPAQPEAARQAAGEAARAADPAAPSVDRVPTTVQTGTPPSSAEAPARTRSSSRSHRALRRQSTGEVEPPIPRRQTERIYGIPVGDIYVNSRGELVDAQGKLLDLAAPPGPGSG